MIVLLIEAITVEDDNNFRKVVKKFETINNQFRVILEYIGYTFCNASDNDK